ncbi:MAG: hypothetical protein Q4Q62_06465 [Thermoplasmata archaeon]|nr:hypothetical protein [Thermoplasmata archaeon]
MSFDEFFLGKRERRGKREAPKAAEKATGEAPEKAAPTADSSGFSRGRPKLNVRGQSILLYIPKYEGGKGAKYEVSVEQDGKTAQLGRLKSSPLDSDVSSLPTEFDLLEAGISPLGAFTVSIDGKAVYEVFAHSHMMFSAEGMPISRAEDTTIVLYPAGKHLWLTEAKVSASTEVGDLLIDTVEVARGGYVRVRDRPQPVPEAEKEEKPKAEPKKAKAKPTGSVTLPAPETVASAKAGKDLLPLYASAPSVTVEAAGDAEFTVSVKKGGEASEVPLAEFAGVPDAVGDVTVTLSAGGKKVASARYFVVPGFSCSYNGKGDIPEGEIVRFTIGSEEHSRNVYEDGMEGPYAFEGGKVSLSWNIPAVTVDLGDGPRPLSEGTVQVDDLPDTIIVSARGAAKKAVFLAGSTGKKVPITPDWEDEAFRIDTSVIRNAVFDSATRSASLFITVNSCPVRRFLTVENSGGTTVSYSAGDVRIVVTGSGEHVCRVYNIDKTVETTTLAQGENTVRAGPGAISAEVVEIRNGKEVASETVQIREIPFLLRDVMGDVWFYVSKDKRIPLPDGLLESKSDAEVRKWHSQIVRMNPELKAVSPEKTVKAFKDFSARGQLDGCPGNYSHMT